MVSQQYLSLVPFSSDETSLRIFFFIVIKVRRFGLKNRPRAVCSCRNRRATQKGQGVELGPSKEIFSLSRRKMSQQQHEVDGYRVPFTDVAYRADIHPLTATHILMRVSVLQEAQGSAQRGPQWYARARPTYSVCLSKGTNFSEGEGLSPPSFLRCHREAAVVATHAPHHSRWLCNPQPTVKGFFTH